MARSPRYEAERRLISARNSVAAAEKALKTARGNRLKTLTSLVEKGAISKTDAARLLGVSRAFVSKVTLESTESPTDVK